ncbi:hypothetical protein EI42_02828 [Thermosporothrix hazakensis]|uniref:Uncharacterized protein n=1 Tax=Thermosporothrix hazakensis TaxID=644383 RepID=A0A326U7N2_THEHA|nr:hypothetical protein EI42_02828 [Thermosporothrix hazakensis]
MIVLFSSIFYAKNQENTKIRKNRDGNTRLRGIFRFSSGISQALFSHIAYTTDKVSLAGVLLYVDTLKGLIDVSSIKKRYLLCDHTKRACYTSYATSSFFSMATIGIPEKRYEASSRRQPVIRMPSSSSETSGETMSTMRPSYITAIRSERARISSSSAETTRTALPASRCSIMRR